MIILVQSKVYVLVYLPVGATGYFFERCGFSGSNVDSHGVEANLNLGLSE